MHDLAALGLGYGRLIWLLMAMAWCRLAMAALAWRRLAIGCSWLGTTWAWLLMAMAWQSPLGYGRLGLAISKSYSLAIAQ